MKIGDKTFMNLQEAVAWLLENNALPFQSTANYAGNTEIALSTLINPSPAKVRVGSIIFFADSKVSTVIGVTSNSFVCSDQYNNLVDDIAYVTGVSINASGHLITTLSDGQTIDAGQIKQVSGFSIDGSQHLIVTFNDGTSTDLGAIFSGNITISGDLTVTGAITGASITEDMVGYSYTKGATSNIAYDYKYAGVCKNGNKITFAVATELTRTDSVSLCSLGVFVVPLEIGNKLFPAKDNWLAFLSLYLGKDYDEGVSVPCLIIKDSSTSIRIVLYDLNDNLTLNDKYYARLDVTFLLSENLAV